MRTFDFVPYLTRPRLGSTSGLIVSVQLVRAAEGLELPTRVVPFLQALRDAAEDMRLVIRARQRHSGSARRPADRRFDAAYGGFYRHLVSWTRQEGEPEAAKAQGLIDHLFPTGLDFLSFKLEDEWVHSRELLAEIDDKKLEPVIVELVGERFFEIVRNAHTGLGMVLGLEGDAAPQLPSLREAIDKLGEALVDYARIFAGTVTNDKSLDLFEAALAPVAELREAQRQRSAGRADDDELDELEGEDGGDGDLFDLDDLDLDQPLPQLGDGEAEPSISE